MASESVDGRNLVVEVEFEFLSLDTRSWSKEQSFAPRIVHLMYLQRCFCSHPVARDWPFAGRISFPSSTQIGELSGAWI